MESNANGIEDMPVSAIFQDPTQKMDNQQKNR